MSDEQTFTSRLLVEAPEWVLIPEVADVSSAWRSEVEDLFAAVAEVDRVDRVERGGGTRSSLDPAGALASLLEFRDALPPEDRLVVHLGLPDRWPLPVVVSVGVTHDGRDDLLELAGASGGLPVEPPVVDELPPHVRGEGPVVTRYDVDDDGAIWASVCAVRREEIAPGVALDTRLLWRTRDLDVVPVFVERLVDLMAGIENEVTA